MAVAPPIDSPGVNRRRGTRETTQRRGGKRIRGSSPARTDSPRGSLDRPTCANRRWGDRRFGAMPRLFDNRRMHAAGRCRSRGRRADGVLTRDTRLPGGGVIRSSGHAAGTPSGIGAVAQLASAPDCRSGECGFESHRLRGTGLGDFNGFGDWSLRVSTESARWPFPDEV